MIKFACKKCGYDIKVKDQHAGKKGKCPKCKTPLVVPSPSNHTGRDSLIRFRCPNCNQKIGLKPAYAGKQVRCAKCRHPVRVPKQTKKTSAMEDVTGSLAAGAAVEPPSNAPFAEFGDEADLLESLQQAEANAPAVSLPQKKESEETYKVAPPSNTPSPDMPMMTEEPEAKQEGKRSLPWPIDILLYPFSLGGVTTVGVFVGGQILCTIASLFCCLAVIVQLLLFCYMGWYFSECIRDSADGGVRAPDTVGRQESLFEIVVQLIRLFLCHVIYLSAGPTIYSFYMLFSPAGPNDTVLLVMTIVGNFLYPMAIIGVSVLSSIEGLNPILLIRSVASTFVQYIGLYILLNCIILMYRFFLAGALIAALRSNSLEMALVVTMLGWGLGIFWLILVLAHVLGRFYWRYEEKLAW